jgi:hypothetical protein
MDKVTNIKGFDTLDLESMVFTSEVVEWELEVRCFVLNNQLITHSSYWRNDAFDTSRFPDQSKKKFLIFSKILFRNIAKRFPKPLFWILGSSKEKAGL